MGWDYGTQGRDKKYIFTNTFLVRNHEGQRPIKRHRHEIHATVWMDFTGIEYVILD
jgi:hypothetical protein